MRLKIIFVFLLTLGAPFFLLAQMRKGWSISPTLHTGFITKHTKKLTIDNSGISEGIGFNFQYQTYGTKDWHARQHFPQVGIETAFFRFSSYKQLGHAFGLLPNITLNLKNKKNWRIRTTIGMGIGWLSTHYDPITHPRHNAIGSHLNNYTSFRFYVEKAWKPQWNWTAGISFSHFSNGTSQIPNYGLNVPAMVLGFNYAPTPVLAEDYRFPTQKADFRKWGFFAEASIARQEYITVGGPKYPIYNLAIAASFNENEGNTSFLGMEYEYSYSVYNFFKFLEQFDEKKTKDTGRRLMIFGGHEFTYGHVGFGAQLGVYLAPYNKHTYNTFYNKLNLKYLFTPFGKKGLKPFLALHMKAHLIDAEYISAGVGLRW